MYKKLLVLSTDGVLSSLIACSNLYLGETYPIPLDNKTAYLTGSGLESGFGADATLSSAIFGYDKMQDARKVQCKQTRQIKTIGYSFSASLVWSIATSYAPGILYSWNPFWWIYAWGGHSVIGAVNWDWLSWQWSPSLIGVGMLVDLNASLSYLLGTVLAWGSRCYFTRHFLVIFADYTPSILRHLAVRDILADSS